MDSSEKIRLSKQIVQSQKTYATANYKKYCDETSFEGLGSRKLFDILSSLKSEQQRIRGVHAHAHERSRECERAKIGSRSWALIWAWAVVIFTAYINS